MHTRPQPICPAWKTIPSSQCGVVVFLNHLSCTLMHLLVRSPASPSRGLLQNSLRFPGAHSIQRRLVPLLQGPACLLVSPEVTALSFIPGAQSLLPEVGMMPEWREGRAQHGFQPKPHMVSVCLTMSISLFPQSEFPLWGHSCSLCQMTLVRTIPVGQMAANLTDPYKGGLGARSSFLPGLPRTATNLPI